MNHFSGVASRIIFPAVQGLVATREIPWGVQYSVHIPVPAQIKMSKKIIRSGFFSYLRDQLL
jgi:hypothetical protein